MLLDAKVGAVKDAIIATSTEATQEATLEELLAKVVAKWAAIELSVVPYKDSKDVYILGSINNIQVGHRGPLLAETLRDVAGLHLLPAALCIRRVCQKAVTTPVVDHRVSGHAVGVVVSCHQMVAVHAGLNSTQPCLPALHAGCA